MTRYGINGAGLQWIFSYLSDRSQRVSAGGKLSEPVSIYIVVPQGSVLGPILFTLYVGPLYDITRKHGLRAHFYADDSQLYISFEKSTELAPPLAKFEACVQDIKQWMKSNYLKLNDDKTEVLLGNRSAFNTLPRITVSIGDSQIDSEPFVKNLGVVFDSELSMNRFISEKCRSAMYYLRCISRIRKYLDIDSTKSLIQALVASRIDYVNSILICVNKTSLHRVQVIPNSAARLIYRTSFREHITPIRKQLHWLPIESRIEYKILIMCFNCIKGTAHWYLRDLIELKHHSRNLRNSSNRYLIVPRTKSRLSEKCFQVKEP